MRLTLWRLFLADNPVHVHFILENSPNMDFFFFIVPPLVKTIKEEWQRHMCFMLPWIWSALFNLRCLQRQPVFWLWIPRDMHHLLSPHLGLGSLCILEKLDHYLKPHFLKINDCKQLFSTPLPHVLTLPDMWVSSGGYKHVSRCCFFRTVLNILPKLMCDVAL